MTANTVGDVFVEGPLEASWTILLLGSDEYSLERDEENPARARCIDLGQIDYETFAFRGTDVPPAFR
jgi:hypothetical protein